MDKAVGETPKGAEIPRVEIPKVEEIPKAEEIPKVENNNEKPEETGTGAEVPKEAEATEVSNKKPQSSFVKRLLFWAALGALLGAGYYGFISVGEAINADTMKALEITPSEFEQLPPEEILNRLNYISASLLHVSSRRMLVQEMWPIMFCLGSLSHPVLAIKETAMKILCQMCEFEELKKVVSQNINLGPVIDEAIRRTPAIKDDAYHHGLISQLLDQDSFRNLAIRKGYIKTVLGLLRDNDPVLRSVAIISIAKLSENEQGRKILAQTDAFQTIYTLLYHPWEDTQGTLVNDGKMLPLRTSVMGKLAIKELGKEVPKPSLSIEQLQSLQALQDYLPQREETVLRGNLMWGCVFRGVAFGLLWGYARSFIRHRWTVKGPLKAAEFRTALKGGAKTAAGTFVLCFLHELDQMTQSMYLQDLEEYTFYSTFVRPFAGTILLFLSTQLTPFSILPTLVGVKSVYHPDKSLLWLTLTEEDTWEKMLRENQ
eukprot:TRINITY_DN14215_c0_g1_i1.p1 TRINITY_DN14215_c0_g1~~TRINITY_DN14215_c0_g1_i1.p1  ORF type:complete len:525 (+),score=128.78 TRINITY_DN14215_c0_g1_i1:120-1577(+)